MKTTSRSKQVNHRLIVLFVKLYRLHNFIFHKNSTPSVLLPILTAKLFELGPGKSLIYLPFNSELSKFAKFATGLPSLKLVLKSLLQSSHTYNTSFERDSRT